MDRGGLRGLFTGSPPEVLRVPCNFGASLAGPRPSRGLRPLAGLLLSLCCAMPLAVQLGLSLGIGIGLVNALVSLALYGWARSREGNGFVHVILGGMALRLPLTAAAAAGVLAFVYVDALAFTGALMATFVACLLAESAVVLRDARSASGLAADPSSFPTP